MKISLITRRIRFIIILALASGMLFPSCNKKIDKIRKNEILSLPSITVHNDTSVFADSGKVKLIMIFPLMESYDRVEEPYSEFREGMKAIFYDGHPDPVGSVSANYAKYINKKNLWELKDSVVVINQTSDRLETEQLYWDQAKDNIYTDRFVRISNEDQTVIGTGFESDSHLNHRRIKNISGTIYLKDE
jgi:LPS export ABC transporter protein LptC